MKVDCILEMNLLLNGNINQFEISPNGKYIVVTTRFENKLYKVNYINNNNENNESQSSSSSIEIESIELSNEIKNMNMYSAKFNSTNDLLVLGCENGIIYIINLTKPNEIKYILGNSDNIPIMNIYLSNDSQFLCCKRYNDNNLLVYDLDNCEISHQIPIGENIISNLMFDNKGEKVIYSTTNNEVFVYNINKDEFNKWSKNNSNKMSEILNSNNNNNGYGCILYINELNNDKYLISGIDYIMLIDLNRDISNDDIDYNNSINNNNNGNNRIKRRRDSFSQKSSKKGDNSIECKNVISCYRKCIKYSPIFDIKSDNDGNLIVVECVWNNSLKYLEDVLERNEFGI